MYTYKNTCITVYIYIYNICIYTHYITVGYSWYISSIFKHPKMIQDFPSHRTSKEHVLCNDAVFLCEEPWEPNEMSMTCFPLPASSNMLVDVSWTSSLWKTIIPAIKHSFTHWSSRLFYYAIVCAYTCFSFSLIHCWMLWDMMNNCAPQMPQLPLHNLQVWRDLTIAWIIKKAMSVTAAFTNMHRWGCLFAKPQLSEGLNMHGVEINELRDRFLAKHDLMVVLPSQLCASYPPAN